MANELERFRFRKFLESSQKQNRSVSAPLPDVMRVSRVRHVDCLEEERVSCRVGFRVGFRVSHGVSAPLPDMMRVSRVRHVDGLEEERVGFWFSAGYS